MSAAVKQPTLSARLSVDLTTAAIQNAEYETRLDAQRASAQFRVAIVPKVAQNAIEDLPLFGGERQGGLFE